MGFFGSGDKIQSSVDARIGVSDTGVLVQPGGFIWNPGRAAENETLSAAPEPDKISNTTLLKFGAGIVALVLILNFLNSKK
jgi:hypothetical protein